MHMNSLIKALMLTFTRILSDRDLTDLILSATKTRIQRLTPADALKFLFNLDAELYPLQGWTSVAYGGGLHTKHRHTKYHDFFIDRVQPGELVLDLGCGNGSLSRDIARSPVRVLWASI